MANRNHNAGFTDAPMISGGSGPLAPDFGLEPGQWPGIMERHAEPGFTLVELVLVVLVVSIMAALVVPTLGNTAQTRLNGAARMLVADIAFAQNESISHNTGDADDQRVLKFDPEDNRRYYVARSDPDATPINHPGTERPYEVIFGQGRAATLDGVTIQSTPDAKRLRFGIYGQVIEPDADDSDPTITLQCQGQTLTIKINGDTGQATIDSEA